MVTTLLLFRGFRVTRDPVETGYVRVLQGLRSNSLVPYGIRLHWSRISPTGEILLMSEISERRRLISCAISLIAVLWLDCISICLSDRIAGWCSTSWLFADSANLMCVGVLDVRSIGEVISASTRLWPPSSPEWLLSYPSENAGSIKIRAARGVLAMLVLISKSRN